MGSPNRLCPRGMALARTAGLGAAAAARVASLGDGTARLAVGGLVSAAWWDFGGGRRRTHGVAARVGATAVLVADAAGGATRWHFADDVTASETRVDDGAVARCRGGGDLSASGAYEPGVGRWRRYAVARNGVAIYALEDVPDDAESTDGPRTLWPSALACCRLLGDLGVRGRRVLELGAGSGLPAHAASVLGAVSVCASEQASGLAFLAENALANGARVDVLDLGWGAPVPAALAPDVVLASDCTYNTALHAPLLDTLAALLRRTPGAAAYVVSDEASTPAAGRTLAAFVASARERRLAVDELAVDDPYAPATIRAFRLTPRGGAS